MALPVIAPPTLSFEDIHPFMTGWQQAMQMGNPMLKGAYEQPNLQAQLDMLRAQAQKEQASAQMPFGGQNLPGPAGQVMGLEAVKRMYGENSEQYKTAKQLFDLSQQSTQSRIGYQNKLGDTLGFRYSTNTAKAIDERERVARGLPPTREAWEDVISPGGPGSSVPGAEGKPQPLQLTDEQIAKLKEGLRASGYDITKIKDNKQNQGAQPTTITPEEGKSRYDLLLQKQTTDADTRKRNLYANNIEKTLGRMNPDDLTRYAGIPGQLSKLKEQALAPFGKESDEYKNYSRAVEDAEYLATQVRQFYGDSIQPSMIDRLQRLTNPSFWGNNPELAKALFEETKEILKIEMATYRDALKSTAPYEGAKSSAPKKQAHELSDEQLRRIAGG